MNMKYNLKGLLIMKRILIILLFLCISFQILGCSDENDDGSKKDTYSSCKIIKSEALLASDRSYDLQQCWDGVDYESKGDALAWCESKVNNYISNRYLIGHSVTYAVESTNCP